MISDLDEHIGAVLQRLEKHGLTDNTLVVFTSDNGTTHRHNNDPRFGIGGVDADFFDSTAGLRGFKGSVYEGGLRVPLIARWPGKIEPGSTSGFPSYFPDHFPTLCDIAGLDKPANLDGISIAPTLLGEGPQTERNPMVWVYPEYGGQVAVNFGSVKAVRTNLAGKRKPADWELFDIDKDPNETTNLATERPDLLAKAKAVLKSQTADNPLFPVDMAKTLGD